MSKPTSENAFFHVLPHPQPRIDPLKEPFVGNECVEDNICEWVHSALWVAIGEAAGMIEVHVDKGTVTLSGHIPSEAYRGGAVRAALDVNGVERVDDTMEVDATRFSPAPPEFLPIGVEDHTDTARDMVAYVTRYCGTNDASVAAAVQDGMHSLSGFFRKHRRKLPDDLILVYRNLIPGAVTVDICAMVPRSLAGKAKGEVHLKKMLAQDRELVVADRGFGAVLKTAEHFTGTSPSTKGSFWQRFRSEQLIPKTHFEPGPLYCSLA